MYFYSFYIVLIINTVTTLDRNSVFFNFHNPVTDAHSNIEWLATYFITRFDCNTLPLESNIVNK